MERIGRVGHALMRWGDTMAHGRRAIGRIQWLMVLAYALLVVLPAGLPPSAPLALFVVWGLWWPLVVLATMLFGRVWCGVFCPDGAMSEFASGYGPNLPIPRTLRWKGWPACTFIAFMLSANATGIYARPKAALAVLGSTTLAAIVVGYRYGRGKRVWCRFLCPMSGPFGLLSRMSPLHFRVDAAAWDAYPVRTPAVDCAPLIDIRRMRSSSQCHACGRCSAHRGAVRLALRAPNAEFLDGAPRDVTTAEAMLLVFGLLGVPIGDALAHRFTTLPPVLAIAATALAIGSTTLQCLRGAAALAGGADWRALALALVPLAGAGLFADASARTIASLQGTPGCAWVGAGVAVMLVSAAAWSTWLAFRLVAPRGIRAIAAAGLLALPPAVSLALWSLAWHAS